MLQKRELDESWMDISEKEREGGKNVWEQSIENEFAP